MMLLSLFLLPSVVAAAADAGTVEKEQLLSFPLKISDLPITAVRKFSAESGAGEACCTQTERGESEEGEALASCLDAAGEFYMSLEAALAFPPTSSQSPGIVMRAIVMMTSAKLRHSYAVYSEATVARFVGSSSSSSSSWDFLAVEVDDSPAASVDRRKPHWLKVPVLFYALRRYRASVLYIDCDATVVHTRCVDPQTPSG